MACTHFLSGSLDDQALIDSDVVFCLDADLRITYCNAGWDRFARENGAPDFRQPTLGPSVLDYMTEPDRACYARIFRRVLTQRQPWEQSYEYPTPDLHRQFRVRVLSLMRQTGLMVISSLQVGEVHQGVPWSPAEKRYRNGQGLILMCCGCRRTRRRAPGEESWEWVPNFIERMPSRVSHGICPACRKHYYAVFPSVLVMQTAKNRFAITRVHPLSPLEPSIRDFKRTAIVQVDPRGAYYRSSHPFEYLLEE